MDVTYFDNSLLYGESFLIDPQFIFKHTNDVNIERDCVLHCLKDGEKENIRKLYSREGELRKVNPIELDLTEIIKSHKKEIVGYVDDFIEKENRAFKILLVYYLKQQFEADTFFSILESPEESVIGILNHSLKWHFDNDKTLFLMFLRQLILSGSIKESNILILLENYISMIEKLPIASKEEVISIEDRKGENQRLQIALIKEIVDKTNAKEYDQTNLAKLIFTIIKGYEPTQKTAYKHIYDILNDYKPSLKKDKENKPVIERLLRNINL